MCVRGRGDALRQLGWYRRTFVLSQWIGTGRFFYEFGGVLDENKKIQTMVSGSFSLMAKPDHTKCKKE